MITAEPIYRIGGLNEINCICQKVLMAMKLGETDWNKEFQDFLMHSLKGGFQAQKHRE